MKQIWFPITKAEIQLKTSGALDSPINTNGLRERMHIFWMSLINGCRVLAFCAGLNCQSNCAQYCLSVLTFTIVMDVD